MFSCFTATPIECDNLEISQDTHNAILSELKKFAWSIDEYDNQPDLITPMVIGSVIEKVVNQKETGSYYTPRDTTNYIAEYSIVFALLHKQPSWTYLLISPELCPKPFLSYMP